MSDNAEGTEYNETLVEQMRYSFDEAIDRGDIEEARKIIEYVKDFDVLSAKILEAELLDQPISNFK